MVLSLEDCSGSGEKSMKMDEKEKVQKKKGGGGGWNIVQSIKMDFTFDLHGSHGSFQAMLLHGLRNIFV